MPPSTAPAITRAQWLVLVAAFLGWMFDGFEMGLMPLIARPALHELLAGASEAQIGAWNGWISAAFLLGAAAGGLLFGWLGDRIGRVRAMSLSILCYSLFTGSGFFAASPWQLAALRFVAALGMGGEWALGVALVMEVWPERWRVLLAGAIGAAANVGFLVVALVMLTADLAAASWRYMLLVGILPALLVVYIQRFVPESERWRAAVAGRRPEPLRELFAPGARRRTLLAIAFTSVALVGTWGCVEWLPVWTDQLVGATDPKAKAIVQVLRSIGAVSGCLLAPLLGQRFGRRPAFFALCIAAFVLCNLLFRFVDHYGPLFLLLAFAVGMAGTAFYGWFPLYLPELFPTRVRATGQGLAYNSGRVLAAVGALLAGTLVGQFGGSYPRASAAISFVYVLGMVVIWLAPETKGRPLPE